MKKIIFTLLICFLLVCTACKNKKEEPQAKPDVVQAKAICELATMECYYNNVAKYYEEDASGFLFWEKDKDFWIEYSGIVTVGIDASRLAIEVDGTTVTISLPPAEVLDCAVDSDSLTEDSFYIADDSAKVKAEDQTQALQVAQQKMREEAENDSELLSDAQQLAQKLLEDYVNNLGEAVGVEYTIEWIYLDANEEADGDTIGDYDPEK